MDQGTLVADQFTDGKTLLREISGIWPLVTAFWVKETDSSEWKLFISSDQFEGHGKVAAYRELSRVASTLNLSLFDLFQVRLVGVNEPAVQAALNLYRNRPPKIPMRLGPGSFGEMDVDEVLLILGPVKGYAMANGRQTLERIIDEEAEFFEREGRPPHKMKLPVLMAYDLAKLGREDLGEMSGKVFKDGITVFENEGFHGMKVEIIRDRNASLAFE